MPVARVPLRRSSIGVPPRRSSLVDMLTARRQSLRLRDSMEENLRPIAIDGDNLSAPEQPQDCLSTGRCAAVVAMLLTSLLFSLLDTTIVSTSLLEAAADLGSFSDSTWIVLAYLLTYMGFSVIFAKLSDIFGRLAILEVSWFLFTTFSLGCGIARTMPQIIVMRAFQGIGGAGLYSLPVICLHEVIPSHRWQLIGAGIAFTLSISYVLGPILGGVVPHLSSWRVLYLINIPVGATVAGGLFLLYPRRPQRDGASALEKLRKIDFLGALLLLAASMMLVYAIQEAGSLKLEWNSVPITVTLTLSSVSWVAFWGWEAVLCARSGHVQPIFPMSLASHRVYLACLFTTLLVGFVFMPTVIMLPERSQIIDNQNVLMAGVDLLPLLAAVAMGSFASGPISLRKNRTTMSLVLGAGLMTTGTALMTMLETMDSASARKAMFGFEAILGFGFGLCLASTTIMANVQGRGADMAVANGSTAQVRVLGSVIGLGIWTIVFNTKAVAGGRLKSEAKGGVLTAAEAEALHRSPSNALLLPEPARSEVRGVYASAFTDQMLVLAVVSALAFALSLVTYETNPPPAQMPPPPARARLPKQLLPAGDGASERELQDIVVVERVDTGGHDSSRASESGSRRESIELGRMPAAPLPIISR